MLSDYFEYLNTARDFTGRCSLETKEASQLRQALSDAGVFSNGNSDLKEPVAQSHALAILFWLRTDEPIEGDGMPRLVRHHLLNKGFVTEDDGVLTTTAKLHNLTATLTDKQILNS